MSMLAPVQRISPWRHAVFFLAFAGCQRDGTVEMKDTEGRAFTVACTETKRCTVEPRKRPDATLTVPLTVRAEGRLLGVCDRDAPPITCRPVVCESEADCPTVDGVARTCRRSLCSEPSRSLSRTDVVMLCMAGSGVGFEETRQRERYGTALAWEPSMPLPAGCRSP